MGVSKSGLENLQSTWGGGEAKKLESCAGMIEHYQLDLN